MSYPTYQIGDKVDAWVRCRNREGLPCHEKAYVSHFGWEIVAGMPLRIYFLKNAEGEPHERHYFSPGLDLIERGAFLRPPDREGPTWKTWLGHSCNISIWYKTAPNGHVGETYVIWDEERGAITSFVGSNLKGMAWNDWTRREEHKSGSVYQHGKHQPGLSVSKGEVYQLPTS